MILNEFINSIKPSVYIIDVTTFGLRELQNRLEKIYDVHRLEKIEPIRGQLFKKSLIICPFNPDDYDRLSNPQIPVIFYLERELKQTCSHPTIRFDDDAEYEKDHCWQYEIRLRNIQEDIDRSSLTKDQIEALKVSDFTFHYVPKDDKAEYQKIKEFIYRHEWLGTMSLYHTHLFITRIKNELAGVVTMDVPNAFSKIMGDQSKDLDIERLISRGACISWSPKGLASALIMWSIRWMVANTHYRVFSAYADPTAYELGTIYQACNFFYIGQKSGQTTQYYYNGDWRSGRIFRNRSTYKRLAKELEIEWDPSWQDVDIIRWENMPDDIEQRLRAASKELERSAPTRQVPPKHKYVYVMGRDKRETRQLRKQFLSLNKTYPYPKERGS